MYLLVIFVELFHATTPLLQHDKSTEEQPLCGSWHRRTEWRMQAMVEIGANCPREPSFDKSRKRNIVIEQATHDALFTKPAQGTEWCNHVGLLRPQRNYLIKIRVIPKFPTWSYIGIWYNPSARRRGHCLDDTLVCVGKKYVFFSTQADTSPFSHWSLFLMGLDSFPHVSANDPFIITWL